MAIKIASLYNIEFYETNTKKIIVRNPKKDINILINTKESNIVDDVEEIEEILTNKLDKIALEYYNDEYGYTKYKKIKDRKNIKFIGHSMNDNYIFYVSFVSEKNRKYLNLLHTT